MPQFTVTSIKAYGEPIEIPGLAELLGSFLVPGPVERKHLEKYDRKVTRKNGRVVTVLTKKQKAKEGRKGK